MNTNEVLKLALENSQPSFLTPGWTLVRNEDITALQEALAKPDFWEGYVPEPMKPAQQGPVFSYTPDMDAVRRDEKEKADKFLAQLAQQALDKKAENARELGLDYEPSTGTQVSKVWWDGEKLMAKPIPFVEFYKPAQRKLVGLTDEERKLVRNSVGYNQFVTAGEYAEHVQKATEFKLLEKNNG